MKISTEIFRRVYNDEHGVYIQVGPDADALDCVEIMTTNPLSREFYGDIRLTLQPEFAVALAEAILATAKDLTKPVIPTGPIPRS